MIDFTGDPKTFNPRAIPASTLLELLLDLGDLNSVIVEPNPTTGNLFVLRRNDKTTMRLLGTINVADECFEPERSVVLFEIPVRWQRDWIA